MTREEILVLRRDQEEKERLARFEQDLAQEKDFSVPECPPMLRIEVTNRCNADCVFCAYQYQERDFTYMDFETFKVAIDQYAALGGTAINFSPVVGDALMDKKFLEKVEYANSLNQFTLMEIWTNAILLSREYFEKLVKAGMTRFFIAMSGFSEAEYYRVYRNKNYQRVFKNLKDIAQSPLIKDVVFVVNARTDSLWPEQKPDYLELKAIDAYPIVFEPGVASWNGAIRQEDLPGHMFVINKPKDKKKPCLVLWGGLTVLADGNMTMCGCCDVNGTALPLGNIHDTPLDQHLKNGKLKGIIDGFYEGKMPKICEDCDSYYPHG